MELIIRNKKSIVIWCFIFTAMLLNLVFAIEKRTAQNANADNSGVIGSYIVLAADTAGSILFDENNYFKKYTIICNDEIDQVKWDETKEYIDIMFNKDDIQNLNLKTEKNTEVSDIYYGDTKENLSIRIKKNFKENNFIYVDKNDKKKVVALISKMDNPFHHSVVIDAGHGGVDKGANFYDIYEKDLTLRIANYAADELMFKGFKVTQTRDVDELLSLKEVGTVVNEASADAFVSVHINENKESKYQGVSTYYYDPNGYQKNERIRLAKALQKEMLQKDDWQDRGIFRQNLAVLRYSQVPCALVECGFLSNPEDRDKLIQDEVLRNFAVDITNGISTYLLGEESNEE